jgi:8-amino-7-oxononanoate synthase
MLGKYAQLKDQLGTLREAGADPFNITFDRILSPTTAEIGGREVLLLGTNNYLGLTFEESCVEKAVAALRADGTGTTGSRIANGTYGAHVALEKRIARFLHRRDAMVFTTGYQANLGALSALAGREDQLLLDADSHASIYDGSRLSEATVTRFRHNDPDDLYRRLKHLADRPGEKLIVVEGIYSMLGDVAPLREFAAVKRETGAYLLVDEAHSLGVLGEHGRGLAEQAGIEEDVDFVVGTFSKSLGSIGGFLASSLPGFEVLRLIARSYMFTASLPPSVAAGVMQALDVLESRPGLRLALNHNAARLYAGLEAAGFRLGPTPSPIVAVRLGSTEIAIAFWNMLLARGLYVNLALPPATPERQALLRTSVSAAHSREEIDFAVAAIAAVGRELGVLSEAGGALSSAAE